MKTITLKPNDELIINATNSHYFIHIQDHFFYGEIKMTIYNTTTQKYSQMKGKPRDRIHFNQSTLHIIYSSKSSICKISVWIINSAMCNNDLVHYSGISSAHLKLSNYNKSFNACYFFESSAKPKITSSDLLYFNANLLYMSDNDTMIEKVVDNITNLAVSELSILLAYFERHFNIHVNYNLSIKTDLKITDFTNKDSYFKSCEENYCYDHDVEAPEFAVKRDVVWYIWLAAYLPPIILLTLGLSLLMITPRKETAYFSSSKLLASEASKNSILSVI